MGYQPPIRHRVERTRNKHSRAVFRNGTIVIRLARGLSKTEEKEHIQDLLRRMTKQVIEEQEEKIVIDPFKKLLDGGEQVTVTIATGKKYRFLIKPGRKTSVRKNTYGWTISIAPKIRRPGLHRLLWKVLADAEHERIERLVNDINETTFGVHISKVKLRFASSQWGSCSPRGVIMLNAALLFLPPSVLRYVITHELAHRKRGDHSAQYWQWVEWAMPTYKRAREELGDYRLPTM